MKGEINLLPTGLAEARLALLYLRQVSRLLRWASGGALLVLAVPLASLLASHFITVNQVTQLEASRDQTAWLAELKATNALLSAVATRLESHATPAARVPEILQSLPAGASVTSLAWEAAEATITLAGTVAQRQDSITIQRRLEALPSVTRVTAPLSNFQTGTATSFSLTVHYAALAPAE